MSHSAFACSLLVIVLTQVVSEGALSTEVDFRFSRPLYNVSIPENSVAKTYASQAPGAERMGIHVRSNTLSDIRYKIVDGDRDKFFKAEDRLVGDFCFLFIRTRTGNNDVLNRERKDKYVLQVRATATKRDGKQKVSYTTDATVVVTVLDTNDLNPLFYPTEYNATVFEDTPIHQSILKVVAEDADLGRNGEIYYSFAEETDKFAIHPMSGVISLSRPLRYNEGTYHELTVLGQDRGAVFRHGSGMVSKAKVRIRVKKVNFFAPEIRIRHHPQIVENSNADIYAIVNVSDKDSGIHGEIKSLEIVDGDPDGHFRIRPTKQKGEFNIEVLKLLDRESTPQGYTLKLRAVDRGVPPRESYKSVPVHLTDLNDNAPVFNKEIYEVKVPETAPVNTPLIRLKVTDADEGRNAQVFLEIVGGNEGGEFNINPETGMLYTAVPLDAESKQFYSLTVSAIDQGNAGTRKQSSAKVKIYVEDTNDNDPIFDESEKFVPIDENLPAGTSVTTVHAKDRDRGENAYISYLIANINKVPFEIDHFSGIIKTTSLLDYESMRREYVLRVRASDWGLPYRRQTEMQLTVKVQDVNDNRPQFEKVDCIGVIPRSISIGSEIITLSAIDFDSGNIISYRIVSGNEDGCFSIDTTSGTITVSCDLNDIRVSEREINVTATDGTHFADIARVHFKLVNTKRNSMPAGRLLSDDTGAFECKDTGVARRLTEVLAAAENNNKPPTEEEFPMMPTRYGQNLKSPEFIDFPAEIKVNESVALGTTLVKLKARDRDLGYNGKLIYGISGGDKHSQFCVDMDTGELKVIGYLDRERESEYFLNITLYDLGKPQKSASRMLPITVLDVNDNAPVFERSLASFRVTENALNGTAIFRANATDADAGDNAKVTYSLITDTRDFAVDRTTGVLAVSNTLDRERQDLYELRIRATDGGGKGPDNPPLYSEALVRISIDDINDNAPKFSLPAYTVKIREDIPKGSVVAVVTASDPDLGSDGEVVYFLEDSDSDGTFKIDRLSGTIRTTKPLDFEERQVHSLIAFASDKGNPSLSSEASVTIYVVDVNENMHAPLFSDMVLNGTVKENQPVGTVVMQVNATDADPPGGDSNIEYSIRGGDGIGIFSIDNEGIIRTLAVLDIETKSHFWLTVFAQDHGVVPLYSSVEVYIEVLNENDNVPLSDEAVYYPTILEDSPAGSSVLQIRASDKDKDPNQKITYKITSGSPERFFSINSSTGLITTTSRKLDRETLDEHILEVQISDNGSPPLSSTTYVVVKIDDINDNAPEFEQISYSVQIPASADFNQAVFQNDSPDDFDGADAATDDDMWDSHSPADLADLDRVFRVLAFDRDSGPNSELHYSIKSGKGKSKFKIDNTTGMVYAQKGFEPGQEYELNIKATDGGNTSKSSICKVSVHVISVPLKSKHPPVILKPPQAVKLTEGDEIGFLVALIEAHDKDNDTLWYDIVGGDPGNDFYIGKETGNILLAQKLDYEAQNEYSLNISVSDSVHTVYTQLNVSVIDINDHRPEFSESTYKVEISEAVPVNTEILRLRATDKDDDSKLIYSLYSARNLISLQTFKVDSITGVIYLTDNLDRESLDEHILTVMVRDGGTPAKRNYARVRIIVHDHNDHVPHFSEQILVGKVYESAVVGSAVLRAFAVDHDKGENARITYSIVSGNFGNVFAIDPELGIISVARELDMTANSEYMLRIKAVDHGQPALFSSVPAHIMLTMADNAPPRFTRKEIAAEIYEDQPLGSYVAHLSVRSTSSLQFEIIDGNTDGAFLISPSTGVITTQKYLDYEVNRFYNLTVITTNMASASATCNVIIHILDKNDNVPRFLQANYSGTISEAAPISSLILTNTSEPLVIKAFDADSEMNALLHYDIIDILPRRYFQIDSTTGAIRTIRLLDHETYDKFTFHVQVSDLGNPKLTSETTARVDIVVTDVNDCPPKFSQSVYNVTLLLPTYKNVAVIQVNATDPDSSESTKLRFDIIEGNKLGIFGIDSSSGLITVLQPDNMKHFYKLHVRVSDGKFSSVAKVMIRVEESDNSGLVFQKPLYEGSIIENSTKITTVCVVNVLGSALNEYLEFKILNPTKMFTIGLTSGVIRTTGIKFDREVQDKYELIIEARSHYSDREKPRVAHVIVKVTILDVNDNCPMFVNLPYYAVVSVDDVKGSIIAKVHAIDLDSAENGEVRYELIKGHGELFKVQRESGDIEIKQNLEGHNREYELLIAAYDKGITPCRTDVTVHVKVIDRSMPVFKKQFYSEVVPENVELHSPLSISIEAESPLSRKLIYSIVKGNELEEFALDFNTGVISVVDELDFEQQPQYELLIRATDSVSGVYAEVPVSIVLQDVNDCPPEFTQENYNVSISEAAQFGTPVLTVIANDNDTGINKKISYSIQNDSSNSSEYFYIDENEGVVYLKQALDHEEASSHHFIVVAKDLGVPSLSSTAHVWLTVLDMNDNPPKFEQTSYSCGLLINANRDQFVTIVKASDPDEVDQNSLRYTIVAGNEQQTFSMNPETGIITLTNLANFGNENTMILNVSVSDGVYTNFARLKVELLPANLHEPKFDKFIVDVQVPENQPSGFPVTVVKATDEDFGEFGTITYSIHSELLSEIFKIDKTSGKLTTKVRLDREKQKLYEVLIMATDGGGKSGFITVRIKVADENDNAPYFLLKEYQTSIHYNYSLNVLFLRVKAVDPDEGPAAQIRYQIYEKKSSEVVEIFQINPETGDLSLKKDTTSWIGEVFQFFVRATDKGPQEKHSDVPVNILIMGPKDYPPVFERKDEKYFLSENSPAGTIITKLKMASNVSATYQIISELDEKPQFEIDNQGQVILAKPLDFETQDSHLIGILALSDSSPPMTALAEVALKVLDENDHAPQFESSPYIIYLAENTEEGTSILKVVAHDEDQGANSEVRYSFSHDLGDMMNIFAIDSHTGWISTLVKLDKEAKMEYKFYVTATDNGTPKHSARTTVIVRLKDYNDSPTLFKKRFYESSVNEDALPGTVLLTLDTVDADSDLTTPVEFYIISGDPSSQFQIRQTGEIYVAKGLDREKVPHYDLQVLVTDGMFTDVTNVSVNILDANDNPPYCLQYRYRQVLSEGILPGSFVLSVLATDNDGPEHSKLRYILSGDGMDNFLLDKDSGHLKTVTYLDREKQSKYTLTAHVHDKERLSWKCSSQIELIISDLNDNPPVFSLPFYSVSLPEDVEVGTLVTKIHATDADIGINRKIKYAFIDSFNNHFKMASDSGIVTLAKPLDREIRAVYNLTVQAVDQGTPQLSSVSTLTVNVQDINDNPPEFANKYYFAVVPEIDAVGTEVVKVLATSKDTGVNADVTYSIIGGNEHKKFAINNKTGVISIADMLDYERAKDYFLTIQAVDGGIPPLSNVATVNITVTDCNDNAPVFSQLSYSARIREDAQIGDKILQVIATDLDSDRNGKVTYSIIRGDDREQFEIDPDSGYVSVAEELDRETTSNYVLEVLARDNGVPVLSRQTLLNIEISDANDNPPIFAQTNYTTVIQEDKPIGYPIIQFKITDADTAPNTEPYTFDFRSGNDGNSFRLEEDGVLRTATKFNHKIKDNYLLQIRVFDNGIPPLYSDAWVVVKVIEESQYPPIITPLEININSYLDEYPGGVIGKVYANDQDQYDTLTYSLSPTVGIAYPTHELFQINRTDGTLTALPRLDVGDYRLNVTVTDGKFHTHSIVKINIEVITEEMLENSVAIRFRQVSPEVFVLSHRKGFVRAVRNAMNCRLKDVIIISVQPSDDDASLRSKRFIVNKDLDVLFTVRKPDEGFFTSESIKKALNDNFEELEESTKLVVEEIVRFKCSNTYCTFGVCQDHYMLDPGRVDPVATDVTSFVSPYHRQKLECVCKEGYGGEKCDTIVNECAREPCPPYKNCVPDASTAGYSCQCPEGFAGAMCDVDISKCHDQNCYIARNPISFSGKSYSQYRIINKKSIEDQLSLSLRIRTVQPTGNLMYAAGKVDYNILEIVNGAVQYRFELGSGEGIVRESTVYISDGRWHEVKLERDRNSAKITVDGLHTAQGSAPGISDILNLQSDEMYLGAEVHQHPSILGFEDIQRGFSGCMDDIRISRMSVPLHKSGDNSVAVLKRFANVEFSCDVNNVLVPPGPCGSQPCMNGGTCHETTAGYECSCHTRFTGTLCELDMDPCASAPCLNGGKCISTVPGDYSCECLFRLSGKRCEYGKYCSPNPCKHGGVCEEGDDRALCKCRAFVGDYCEFDLNECESSPCQNGGSCFNDVGSFHCVCPQNTTGPYCGSQLYSTSITSSIYNITWEELVAIAVGIVLILLLVILFVICRKCYTKRTRRRRNINNENIKDHIVLNSTRPHEMSEFKRGSKLSNLEVNQREIPVCPPRPVSYTATSQNDALYNCNNTMMLNNLDTLRSYGSAGDELENVPPDYVRNLNRNTGQNCISNHCEPEKTTWAEQMHLASSLNDKPKVKNDYKISSPVNCDVPNRLYGGRSNTMNYVKSNGSVCPEEDQRSVGSYHWDCSDWARHSQTLPNITEVPGSEIPDSSSFHSNESNESRCHHLPPVLGPLDPHRDIETLNEDAESEFMADSEYDAHGASPSLNALDSGNEEFRFTTVPLIIVKPTDSYIRHPNSYLPSHGYNIPSESEGECLQSPGAESDDVEPYGFPSNRNRRKNCDDDIGSVITTLEERNSLLGGYGSNSDLSTNLCEIEDSECEAEHKPLNYLGGVQQTSV
ncbi:fat-like cadherin-related tumor suppressor homolog isoform X3 [Tribolium castaneum]|uniref:fat-like cadherin-related tumor suppressor homolog isoform X3 n=1 Tax=Tribolium castaneum TaxID=7070 RepID=UPI00077DA08E|nr:PREDICTED: fat-like cadherin-related tumor suppressor homolog isoform X3 [Tribolium castaneum]|eukprot:XP_015840544.1 PREDICTED: fat-like cadherin-related tumor suppressor homolog isoform X3 [Tribolium castaneum]